MGEPGVPPYGVVGELIADRYELEELVGSGGMSNVFRAHDRLLERTVAIKILHEQFTRDDDYVERFRREARAVAQLAHPNIVTVIDRGEQDGRQYIVFEYIAGANLKDLLDDGPLPIEDALDLTIQTGRALAFAHERGVVHRDVKPQNVLLTDEGEPKVTDFGIARTLDVQGVTQTGTVLGTSDYIAPEQARGEKVDAKTDIYSLGAVLYELLTGEVPFPGDNFVAVAMRHLHDPVPGLLERRPDAPARLDYALHRAMEKDPDDRFESMGDFVAELAACRAELDGAGEGATFVLPIETAPAPRPRQRGPRRQSLAPLLLAGAAGLLIAVAVGILLFTDSGNNVLPGRNEPPPAATRNVRLSAIGAYDPFGDNSEHDEDAALATDGNAGTYWRTEQYDSFTKEGVGLVLDAGSPVRLSKLVVEGGDGPFQAQIQASDSSASGFEPISEGWQDVSSSTTFDVDTKGERYEYYMVWLRLPGGGRARISEVKTG